MQGRFRRLFFIVTIVSLLLAACASGVPAGDSAATEGGAEKTTVEFWFADPNRLHDRFEYTRVDAAAPWIVRRLAP